MHIAQCTCLTSEKFGLRRIFEELCVGRTFSRFCVLNLTVTKIYGLKLIGCKVSSKYLRFNLLTRFLFQVFTATVQEFMSHANTALINYYNSIVPNGADYILRVRGLTHDKDLSEKDVVR